MAHSVFISHSAKDKVTADAVCAMLESEGLRCWIAPRDVLPSIEWGEAIIDAIEECQIMVLVFSANANTSPQIRKEVERAVNRGVAILPIRVEDVMPAKALEYFIGNVHWLDASTPPLEAHLKSLAGTIKILLARTESRATPTAPATSTGGMLQYAKQPEPAPRAPLLTEAEPSKPEVSRPVVAPEELADESLEERVVPEAVPDPAPADTATPAESRAVEIETLSSVSQETPADGLTKVSATATRKASIGRVWMLVMLGAAVALILLLAVFMAFRRGSSLRSEPFWVARNSGTADVLTLISGSSDGSRLWVFSLGTYVGSGAAAWESDDGGAQWNRRTIVTNDQVNSVFETSDGRKLWAATSGGTVLASSDAGDHWIAYSSGTTSDFTSIFGTGDGRRLWTATDRGTILESDDGGAHWKLRNDGNTQPLYSIFGASNASRLWASGYNGIILMSADGGAHWIARNSGTGESLGSIFGSSSGEHAWAVGTNGTIVESTDGGDYWIARHSGTKNELNSIFGSSDGQRLWAVGTNGTILESDDEGVTWKAQSKGTSYDLTSIFETSDGKRVWAVGDHGTILELDR